MNDIDVHFQIDLSEQAVYLYDPISMGYTQ